MHIRSRFNTSHVTLYLKMKKMYNHENWRFNTSHVTLYPLQSILDLALQ